MRKFYTGVVKHKKIIVVLFLIASVICLGMKNLVAVNYDMNDYLPKDTSSTISLEVMETEFTGGIPNARVLVRNVTIPGALQYKEKLEAVDGVTQVLWLDDATDITEPVEVMEQKVVETYYKDNTALFTLTIEEEKQLKAVQEIRDLIGNENAMTGNAVSTAVATTSTVSEIQKIAGLAIVFVLLVLLVTTRSWLEPFMVLLGLGIAISINSGTNLIFGEISFVTNAAGSILQLAVSLDYSVFLIHRFEECRRDCEDAETAMVEALCKSTGSILSSGLTTVIGFLALILMKFEIGPDLGLALAKGIVFSLLIVFIFMPAFILCVYPWMDKTRHRAFLPSFQWLGKAVCCMMLPLCGIFLLLVVPSYLASNANSYYYGSGHIFNEKTQLGADTAAIEEIFGKSDTYVLLVPKGDVAKETQLSEELHSLPRVTDVVSYVDVAGASIPLEYPDGDTVSKIISPNYSRMVLSVAVESEGKETFALVEHIREIAQKYYPENYYLAGQGVSTYDLMDTVTRDMVKVNIVAIVAVLFVLLILTKNIALPVILVLSIETAVWLNLSLPYFMDKSVFFIAYLIISSVQLGATVDYAILLSDRYREFRQDMDKKQAVTETVSAVTISIMTSGSVLSVVGFLLGQFSSHGLLAQLGNFLGAGAICSVVSVLFVLPGLLYLTDGLFIANV